MIFTLRQDGNALTGSVESAGGGGFGGGGGGGVIEDGKIDGANISFRVGMTTYTGTTNGDRIELAEERRLWRPWRPWRAGRSCGRRGPASGDRPAAERNGPIVRWGRRRPWRWSGPDAAGASARATVAPVPVLSPSVDPLAQFQAANDGVGLVLVDQRVVHAEFALLEARQPIERRCDHGVEKQQLRRARRSAWLRGPPCVQL